MGAGDHSSLFGSSVLLEFRVCWTWNEVSRSPGWPEEQAELPPWACTWLRGLGPQMWVALGPRPWSEEAGPIEVSPPSAGLQT